MNKSKQLQDKKEKLIEDYWDGYEWIKHNRKDIPQCHRCGNLTERCFILRGDYGCNYCMINAMNDKDLF